MTIVEITTNLIELLASTGLGMVMGVPCGYWLASKGWHL